MTNNKSLTNSRIKASLIQFQTFLNKCIDSLSSPAELKLWLNNAINILNEFNKIQNKIENYLIKDETRDLSESEAIRKQFEDKFDEVLAQADLVSSFNTNVNNITGICSSEDWYLQKGDSINITTQIRCHKLNSGILSILWKLDAIQEDIYSYYW